MGSKMSATVSEETTSSPATDQSQETSGISYVVVGIPAYNEEHGIASTVLGAKEYVDEVIVVDDGSSDQTAERARQAGATVVQHQTNKGKGAAVKTLFEHVQDIGCEALVILDGDGQHLPRDIPTVAKPVLDGDADLTIGSRYLENKSDDETPLYRRFGQRVLDLLTTSSAGVDLTDTQSGFRALSPTAIEQLTIQANGISVESEMIDIAVQCNLTIEEAPIDVRYEGIDGQTYNPLHHGLAVVLFILRLVRDKHPLLFFGVPGLLLTIAGTLYGLNGILIYQNTGNFYPAKVLVSGFASIVGVLGIFCGLILNRISNMIAELHEVVN